MSISSRNSLSGRFVTLWFERSVIVDFEPVQETGANVTIQEEITLKEVCRPMAMTLSNGDHTGNIVMTGNRPQAKLVFFFFGGQPQSAVLKVGLSHGSLTFLAKSDIS